LQQLRIDTEGFPDKKRRGPHKEARPKTRSEHARRPAASALPSWSTIAEGSATGGAQDLLDRLGAVTLVVSRAHVNGALLRLLLANYKDVVELL
jgi:hypothetical protein